MKDFAINPKHAINMRYLNEPWIKHPVLSVLLACLLIFFGFLFTIFLGLFILSMTLWRWRHIFIYLFCFLFGREKKNTGERLFEEREFRNEDGDNLIGKVFSLQTPILILSEIESESGKNDQKGFMQIFKGAYQGIRNPKAHSLTHDLTDTKAAQYLVFASLLARRVDEANIVE